MPQQLLQVNFRFDLSIRDFEETVNLIVEKFSAVPGLQWKIWLMDQEKKQGGGIYLFHSKEALDEFRQSLLFKSMEEHPAFSVFSAKQFSILEQPSAITYAPLHSLQNEHAR